MPCNPLKDADGRVVGFACSRGPRKKAPRCLYCGRENAGTILCDFDVGNGRTCDRAMCPGCAVHVGPNRDHCPDHAR